MFGRKQEAGQPVSGPQGSSSAADGLSLQLIAQKLERLRWRRRVWGVDEQQAWHVIGRLDEMYRQLYREQRLQYEVLLAQARRERDEARRAAQAIAPVQPAATAPRERA